MNEQPTNPLPSVTFALTGAALKTACTDQIKALQAHICTEIDALVERWMLALQQANIIGDKAVCQAWLEAVAEHPHDDDNKLAQHTKLTPPARPQHPFFIPDCIEGLRRWLREVQPQALEYQRCARHLLDEVVYPLTLPELAWFGL